MPRMLRAACLKLNRLIIRAPDGKATLFNDLDDGQSVEFDEKHPFEYLWPMQEETWWKEKLEDKANFVLMKITDTDAYLDGDGRTSGSYGKHMASARTG